MMSASPTTRKTILSDVPKSARSWEANARPLTNVDLIGSLSQLKHLQSIDWPCTEVIEALVPSDLKAVFEACPRLGRIRLGQSEEGSESVSLSREDVLEKRALGPI